jgi:hypothetical protein
MAFKCLTCSRQIATTKLIHDLTDTNVQNHRHYHKSYKFPCCLTMDETFARVLSCSSNASNEHRNQALQELQKDLKSTNTPSAVEDAMYHVINMWLCQQNDPECVVQALTAGSLKGSDMLLTMAFHEQFHTIGYNMFHGRLSKLWGCAVLQITKSPYSSFPTTWAAQTILYLWKYTRSLCMHRNQVVHGKPDQEIAVKIKESIHNQV